MKKVLIISFFFNNKEEIGSVRLRGLAKYLPEYGWEPTILTIKRGNESESGFRTLETEYSDLVANWESKLGLNSENIKLKSKENHKNFTESLIKVWLEIFAYPDPEKNWYKPAVKAGSELLEKEHFDAILSSSSPVTCHLIANKLKEIYKIPWIADLRDLWAYNHYYNFSRFRVFRDINLEKRTLASANVLSTVSKPLADKLIELHENKNVVTILNGFDPKNKAEKVRMLDKKFSIIYTGRIYEKNMDIELLFKAISQLNKEKEINLDDFSIEFYGNQKHLLEKQLSPHINKYNLKRIIKIHGQVSHEDALKRQKKSQLLLLLNWNDPKEKGVFTGKIFEYLSAQRPIIALGGYGGVVKELLEQTKAGVSLNNTNELKRIIKSFYSEFKLNGEAKYSGIPKEIDKYSHKEMAMRFSEVLERINNF